MMACATVNTETYSLPSIFLLLSNGNVVTMYHSSTSLVSTSKYATTS